MSVTFHRTCYGSDKRTMSLLFICDMFDYSYMHEWMRHNCRHFLHYLSSFFRYDLLGPLYFCFQPCSRMPAYMFFILLICAFCPFCCHGWRFTGLKPSSSGTLQILFRDVSDQYTLFCYPDLHQNFNHFACHLGSLLSCQTCESTIFVSLLP